MSLWSWLVSPCLFIGHGQRITTRAKADPGEIGPLMFACERCHQSLGPVLSSEMITDPLPQSVAGAPTSKARRVTRANVSTWKRGRA